MPTSGGRQDHATSDGCGPGGLRRLLAATAAGRDPSAPDGDAATVVASEPLFDEDRVWRDVPCNHRVTVVADGTTSGDPLAVDAPPT